MGALVAAHIQLRLSSNMASKPQEIARKVSSFLQHRLGRQQFSAIEPTLAFTLHLHFIREKSYHRESSQTCEMKKLLPLISCDIVRTENYDTYIFGC